MPSSPPVGTTFCIILHEFCFEWVSGPWELHPEALAELYVSLATHTAPIMEPRRTPICQWANNCGARREMRAIQCVARRKWGRSFLYFRLAHRTKSRSRSRMVG